MCLNIKPIKLIFLIYFVFFLSNCGNVRYKSIDQFQIYFNPKIYHSKEKIFEVTFACDQWYYFHKLNPGYKLNEDDCTILVDQKIQIIGEIENTYIGHISDNLYLFADKNIINERLNSDKIIYKFCKNVIYTRTSSFNFKNANLFLKSTQKPEEFLDLCFEIHKDFHFMKALFKVNEDEYIYNIRSTMVFLTFHNEYKMDKNTRFILKVIGSKYYTAYNEIKKYPHYQAFQIE